MKLIASIAVAVSSISLISLAYAEAPVIEESSAYTMLDAQTYGIEESPTEKSQLSQQDDEATEPMRPLVSSSSTPADNPANADQIMALQQELQDLRGQLEVQAHDLKLMQQQQLAFYKDLDKRIQDIQKQPSTQEPLTMSTGSSSLKTNEHGNPADEQIRYLAAYDLIKQKKFEEALQAMQNFIGQYPNGGYTANAHYWLGELYLVKQQNVQAISEFDIVLARFPTSSKAAPSHLKIALAQAAMGDISDARGRLKSILQKYPDTHTARIAAKKLEAL